MRRSDLGAGREDTELQSRIAILIEVLLEGQPAQDSTDKRTEELGNDVDGNIRAGDKNSSSLICRNTVESLAGVKEVGDNLCDGDCGVQVSAGTESDINTCEYCKSPSEVDHEPTATLAFGLGEQIRGNDAATKEKKYRSSKELRPEDLCCCHRKLRVNGWENCCEHISLTFSVASSRRGHRRDFTAMQVPPDHPHSKMRCGSRLVSHLLPFTPNG